MRYEIYQKSRKGTQLVATGADEGIARIIYDALYDYSRAHGDHCRFELWAWKQDATLNNTPKLLQYTR